MFSGSQKPWLAGCNIESNIFILNCQKRSVVFLQAILCTQLLSEMRCSDDLMPFGEFSLSRQGKEMMSQEYH